MSTLVAKIGKLFATVLGIVAILLGITLYVGNAGIPFVEGTWETESGSAYGFEIGMLKGEALAAMRSRYSIPDHYIEITWLKDPDTDIRLRDFENTQHANRASSRYGIYRMAVVDLNDLTPPLEMSPKWELRLPASWVNAIYLEFEGESLHRITKDRWLFERP